MPQNKRYPNESVQDFQNRMAEQSMQESLKSLMQDKAGNRMDKPIGTVEWNDGPGDNAFKKPAPPKLDKPIGKVEYNEDGSFKNPGPQRAKPLYGITDQMADEWLTNNPVDTKDGGYIRRDDVRELMRDSQSMKPIEVQAKRYNEDFSTKGTPQNPWTKSQEDMDLQIKLKNMNFDVAIDGIYGKQTAQAEKQYDGYISQGFDDKEISDIVYAKKHGYPAHLLESGNKELYKKWQTGINNLSDEEYKMVYPDAKSNKEIYDEKVQRVRERLSKFNPFDALKRVK